ncbi:MAG TPA: proline dehydrogenase family protein [Gemmatimonadales bacterium]|nr:proline dehydrogenase family protein [Gemmatimonadales bacterium]
MPFLRSVLLAASENQWLAHQVRNRAFARRAVRRFMPGEDLDSATQAARKLAETNISTVLTQLGEHVNDRAEAEAVSRHYLEVMDRIQRERLPAHISVKPTHLGLNLGKDVCQAQLDRLVAHAAQGGHFVWVDMENSEYVDATLELYRNARGKHANVGLCLQSYLYRTPEDLESLLPLRPTIRLVKGAYKESATVAFPRKSDVDDRFFTLAMRLLDARDQQERAPGIATHDINLIDRILAAAAGRKIASDAFEIQMLYGIRTADQYRYAAAGKKVRVLISYGSAWFPWYMRRLAERPANLWFVVRSLL